MIPDDSKPCPICGEAIKQVAIKCRFCHTDLVALVTEREADIEKPFFVGHPAVIYSVWQWVAIVMTVGVAYVYYWLHSISITYYITNQRVKVERGIFSKVMDSIELFTIEHFDISKSLGMRLAGFCHLQLRSSDANYPWVQIYGIDNLESLADKLRECSLRERTRRRVTSIIQP